MPDFHQGTLVVTQKPHYPTMHTRETVTHLAAFGMDERQIAVIMKCTFEDVRKHYTNEYEHGLTRINAQVMSAVLHEALHTRDVAAMKFWLINKAGWRAGDARLGLQLPGGLNADGEPTGELTVHERREVITRLISRATLEKRNAEKTIEGTLVADQTRPGARAVGGGNGANGNGSGVHRADSGPATPAQKKSNGSNGNGNGNGNGHK